MSLNLPEITLTSWLGRQWLCCWRFRTISCGPPLHHFICTTLCLHTMTSHTKLYYKKMFLVPVRHNYEQTIIILCCRGKFYMPGNMPYHFSLELRMERMDLVLWLQEDKTQGIEWKRKKNCSVFSFFLTCWNIFFFFTIFKSFVEYYVAAEFSTNFHSEKCKQWKIISFSLTMDCSQRRLYSFFRQKFW